MITIKQFCEKYECDISAIYRKIKRKSSELEGHLKKLNGTLQIDELAEEILKPTELQKENLSLKKKGKGAENDAFLAKRRYENLEHKFYSAERETQELKEKCGLLSVELEELRSSYNRLKEENDILISENRELRTRIDELEARPKSLFGRR